MAPGRPSAGVVIAAILLPPLGVYLARGLGPTFWIATLLTLFWWLPGIVFALVVVFGGVSRRTTATSG